jgi:transposase-like protein
MKFRYEVFGTLKNRTTILHREKRIKNNKAICYDGIPAEVWEIFYTAKDGIKLFKNMFNKIKKRETFPIDWEISNVLSFKGKCKRKNEETAEGFCFYCVEKYFLEYWWVSQEIG